MEGSVTPSPTAICSPLRSSTAPRESRPADINGASASTEPPAVRCTSVITASNPTEAAITVRVDAAAGAAERWSNANDERKAGIALPPPSMRPHETGIIATTEGPPAPTAASSAARPCASSISPSPCAFNLAFTPPPEAIPSCAHGPHCTLTPVTPAPRRNLANASRQLFAAP